MFFFGKGKQFGEAVEVFFFSFFFRKFIFVSSSWYFLIALIFGTSGV